MMQVRALHVGFIFMRRGNNPQVAVNKHEKGQRDFLGQQECLCMEKQKQKTYR